ncbi:DUF6522 family protein [Pseudochelatococcus sp. B33]
MPAAMRKSAIVRDASGAFTVDADMLAERLGRSPRELRDLMRRGLVASRVERGEGDDRGRWRLSVRCGNRRWRAIIEADGTIADQHVDFVPLRKGPAAAPSGG